MNDVMAFVNALDALVILIREKEQYEGREAGYYSLSVETFGSQHFDVYDTFGDSVFSGSSMELLTWLRWQKLALEAEIGNPTRN